MEFSRTHNILDLRNAVIKVGFDTPVTDEDAVFLNSIYRARYPADLGLLPAGEPVREDAENALDIARRMPDWLKQTLE